MALIRCAECKAKVSDKASACPKCGAPIEISKKKQKSLITTGCGCLIVLLVVGGIIVAFVASDQGGSSSSASPSPTKPSLQPSTPVPQHTVVSTEDLSYATVVRKSYRVRVPKEMTKQELTAISDDIVRQATSRQKIKAIVIFYYLPDSDTNGAFTAGKGMWAPGGDWSKASTSLSPRLVVETGGAIVTISKENVVALPVAKKKQVFMQIVRNEDRGMDQDQSCAAAARQFGITTDQAHKIRLEGIFTFWPMP